MFRTAINSTPFIGDLANSVFDRIGGNDCRGDESFISTLRALVFPRMSPEDTLVFQYRKSEYNERAVSNANYEAVFNAVTNGSLRSLDSNFIGVYNANCGSESDDNAVLNVIETGFQKSAYAKDYVKIDKVSEFFKKSFRAFCYINPKTKSTLVFCGGMDLRKFHFLQIAIPVMMPWYFDPDAGVSEMEMAVLQSFREKTPDNYLSALNAIAAQYDFRSLRIKNKLAGFENRFLEREIRNLSNTIERNMGDVRHFEREIDTILTKCYDMNVKLLGLQAKANETSGESEIVDYFMCNKNLYILDVNDSTFSFCCKGYLEYFDEEILKKFLSNNRSVIYNPDGREHTSIFSHDDIKKLMTALFIDQSIHMKFCAAFTFDLRGVVNPIGGYSFNSDFSDCTPNTHIDRYTCLGNHKKLINEQLAKNNYIGAVEQCICSCKSLNFADNPVISEFMCRLYGISHYNVNIRCIELPDGTVVTPKGAIAWLRGQDEQKKKEREAREAAEAAKEETHE